MPLSRTLSGKVLAVIVIVSALLTPGGQSVIAQSRESESCSPVGRIIQGTSANFSRGQVICEGDVIRAPRDVEFLCFPGNPVISISDDTVVNNSLCAGATVPSAVRRCNRTGISQLFCLIAKGPEEQFQLLQPDAVSANPRPTISWESVPDAESYTVRVVGPGISWERVVNADVTEIGYPEDEDSMTEGNAYEVFVFAEKPQELLTASKIVNIQEGEQLISLSITRPQ